MTIALMFVGLLVCLLILRLPVAFALLVPSLAYLLLSGEASLAVALQQVTGGVDNFILLAIPMFILMGNLANVVGVTERLFDGAQALIGRLKGSHGYINVLVSFGFSWMNGAALADVGATAKMVVPIMTRAGYSRSYSAGVTVASSLIGPILPPSIPAVIFALTAGISIGGMLMAGFVPGLVIVVALMISVAIMSRTWDHLRSPAMSVSTRLVMMAKSVPAMIAPVILIGGILLGVFTPTEAAGVAVAYMVILGIVDRKLSLRLAWEAILSTTRSTAGIMLIIASATLFGWILSLEGAARILTDLILNNISSTVVFLLLLNVVLLVLGTVMETGAVILILVPVLMPAAVEFGISPYQLGIIVVFNLMIGLMTPPVGLLLYVLKATTDLTMAEIYRGVLRFAAPLLICLALFTFIPELSTWLPERLGF